MHKLLFLLVFIFGTNRAIPKHTRKCRQVKQMKNSALHSNNISVAATNKLESKTHPAAFINKPLAMTAAALLSPVWLGNAVVSKLQGKPVLSKSVRLDSLGRKVTISRFSAGVMRSSAMMLDVLANKLAFVGASLNHKLSFQGQQDILRNYRVPSAITSLHDVHAMTGLAEFSKDESMEKQANGSLMMVLGILVKAALLKLVFAKGALRSHKQVSVFGVTLDNVKMNQAVNWVVEKQPLDKFQSYTNNNSTQIGYFVNAHSINTLNKNKQFKECLNSADALFADGSGMRMATKSAGFHLVANLNGTDMLPKICQAAAAQGKSIFMLGSQDKVAQQAAQNLQKQYPNLRIAGTHHGFFGADDEEKSMEMVAKINKSNADIVLVGFGSPQQEFWCQRYAQHLNSTTVLAVGGLFDYYSGQIKRAPLFMRELGLEWVWRLMQEPKTKFTRYVIGTPEFLIRTFILKQA